MLDSFFFWFIDDVANLAPRKWPFCVASDFLVSLIDDDVDFRHQKRNGKKNVGLVFFLVHRRRGKFGSSKMAVLRCIRFLGFSNWWWCGLSTPKKKEKEKCWTRFLCVILIEILIAYSKKLFDSSFTHFLWFMVSLFPVRLRWFVIWCGPNYEWSSNLVKQS